MFVMSFEFGVATFSQESDIYEMSNDSNNAIFLGVVMVIILILFIYTLRCDLCPKLRLRHKSHCWV